MDYAVSVPGYIQEEYRRGQRTNDDAAKTARDYHLLRERYVQPHAYAQRFERERRNLLKFIPFTHIRQFPRQGNEGLYGFTLPGSGTIHQREDLGSLWMGRWSKKEENEVHESIHTPDEYETRRLTEWIMESMFPEEEKYRTKPLNYMR